jgi:hypothetical protein
MKIATNVAMTPTAPNMIKKTTQRTVSSMLTPSLLVHHAIRLQRSILCVPTIAEELFQHET